MGRRSSLVALFGRDHTSHTSRMTARVSASATVSRSWLNRLPSPGALGNSACVDVGQLAEPRVPVGGEDGAAGGAAGGGNDEVMGSSALALSGGVGQQGRMVLGHRPVVCVHRYDGEDLIEESSLSCLPSSVPIEVHPGKIFGDDNCRDGDVGIVGNGGSSSHGSHEHAGVEDQAVHGSRSSSVDAAARAVSMDSAKSSSRAAAPRQRVSTAFSAAPVAAGVGAIDAIRRPARVTTMISPRSTESSTAEKFLDASDAVTSRMQSEYHNLNFRSPLSLLSDRCGIRMPPKRTHARTIPTPHAIRRYIGEKYRRSGLLHLLHQHWTAPLTCAADHTAFTAGSLRAPIVYSSLMTENGYESSIANKTAEHTNAVVLQQQSRRNGNR